MLQQMIDLLNEKIRYLEHKNEEKRKEISRLKRIIGDLKKQKEE